MYGMTMAAVLPADIAEEPYTFLLGGSNASTVDEIQSKVGGVFDAVTMRAVNEDDMSSFVMVGYIHDEGLLLDLPFNATASTLFGRELRGDVVIVSGTNPDTHEYDGENHDLPMNFYEYIVHVMHKSARESVAVSRMLASAVGLGMAAGIITQEEFEYLQKYAELRGQTDVSGTLDSMPERWVSLVTKCVAYAIEQTEKDGE